MSDKNKLELLPEVPFEANHIEDDLESWVEGNPEILGKDLLVVGRQCITPVGRLDLLCIDGDGVPVIVELKRASTPREAIAQSLDYASWLDSRTEDEFKELAGKFLRKPLAQAFSEHFPSDLPPIECPEAPHHFGCAPAGRSC